MAMTHSPLAPNRMNSLAVQILIVIDETAVRQLLRSSLSARGFEVTEVTNGADAFAAMMRNPDLVILETELQDMNGIDFLRAVRSSGSVTPILILSGHDKEARKVEALDSGADDYITKPFGMKELLARVDTALRLRLQKKMEKAAFEVEGLSVDLVRRIVKVNGASVKLAPKEYDLLVLLVRHAGKVLTHAFIMKELWSTVNGPQYLRVLIGQLRQKLEASPQSPRFILTETGVGYRLRAPE